MKMDELTQEQKNLLVEAGKLYRNDWYAKNKEKHRAYSAKYRLKKLIESGNHPEIVKKAKEIGLLEQIEK